VADRWRLIQAGAVQWRSAATRRDGGDCENFVDCLLAMQSASEWWPWPAAAPAGKKPGRQQIAASRPKQVLVWLDNDLVGCPNAETYHPSCWPSGRPHPQATHTPEPNGPKIANALLEAGVRASVYQWPKGTPPKADVGAALMRAA
jgi:hypothetical protein